MMEINFIILNIQIQKQDIRKVCMKDCFICEIDINHFDLNKNEHEIKIEFKHKYLTEIKGWLINYAKLVGKFDMSLFLIRK